MSVGELDVFSQPAMRHGQIPQNIRLFTWVTTPQHEDQDYLGTQGTVDRMETTQSDVDRRPYRVVDRGEGHGDDRSWRTNHLRTTSFPILFLNLSPSPQRHQRESNELRVSSIFHSPASTLALGACTARSSLAVASCGECNACGEPRPITCFVGRQRHEAGAAFLSLSLSAQAGTLHQGSRTQHRHSMALSYIYGLEAPLRGWLVDGSAHLTGLIPPHSSHAPTRKKHTGTTDDVGSFIDRETPIALAATLANIGTSSGAGPGMVVASPSRENPDCERQEKKGQRTQSKGGGCLVLASLFAAA